MVKAPLAPRARSLATVIFGSAVLAGVLPAQASAATSGPALIASAVANIAVATDCRRSPALQFTRSQVVGQAALISRPSRKPMSALERMRLQQENPAAATMGASFAEMAKPADFAPAVVADNSPLVPAAFGGIGCAELFDSVQPGIARPQYDFLESRILPVSTTTFDADWTRVSGKAGSAAVRKAVLKIGGGEGAMADRIATVNAWVNRRVAYTPDAKLYGKADYWASASETLARGKGDCEDYAIAKMDILAAMGVAREDMYLTIARDLVRRDDHAILIVKLEGRSILLDNASDELIDGDVANDYRPILSFNADKRFLHGY
ncbi:transglutaminase-like cysteine peptidase [Croceicoccus bisphenolivorans]|uniref:transglutaminase-like cysteine peptidase n=1 Tax=Croceicoccus bisphenolivorans TaxID=1783232 RepID=UPI0008335141|nr:transglutaminase-like cysteine peptidase [Croceicoccus bisphenolivorans]